MKAEMKPVVLSPDTFIMSAEYGKISIINYKTDQIQTIDLGCTDILACARLNHKTFAVCTLKSGLGYSCLTSTLVSPVTIFARTPGITTTTDEARVRCKSGIF